MKIQIPSKISSYVYLFISGFFMNQMKKKQKKNINSLKSKWEIMLCLTGMEMQTSTALEKKSGLALEMARLGGLCNEELLVLRLRDGDTVQSSRHVAPETDVHSSGRWKGKEDQGAAPSWRGGDKLPNKQRHDAPAEGITRTALISTRHTHTSVRLHARIQRFNENTIPIHTHKLFCFCCWITSEEG